MKQPSSVASSDTPLVTYCLLSIRLHISDRQAVTLDVPQQMDYDWWIALSVRLCEKATFAFQATAFITVGYDSDIVI